MHALSCKLLYSEVFAKKTTVEAQASLASLFNSFKVSKIYLNLPYTTAATDYYFTDHGHLFCGFCFVVLLEEGGCACGKVFAERIHEKYCMLFFCNCLLTLRTISKNE